MYSIRYHAAPLYTPDVLSPRCRQRCWSALEYYFHDAPLPPRPACTPYRWQHVGQGFPLDWFTDTFNRLSVAMSVLAVAMGPAVTAAHDLAGGPLGPFKISLVLTGINGFLLFSWRRDSNKAPPACSDIGRLASHAWSAVMGGSGGGAGNKVALVAVTQGCFEAATFAFALLWTPLLWTSRDPEGGGRDSPGELPWGIVFSQQLVSVLLLYLAFIVAVDRCIGWMTA